MVLIVAIDVVTNAAILLISSGGVIIVMGMMKRTSFLDILVLVVSQCRLWQERVLVTVVLDCTNVGFHNTTSGGDRSRCWETNTMGWRNRIKHWPRQHSR